MCSNSWRLHSITDLSAHRCHALKRYPSHTGTDPFPSCLSARVHQGALQLYKPLQNAPNHFLLSLLTKALLSHTPVHCYYDNSITMPPNYQCMISVVGSSTPTSSQIRQPYSQVSFNRASPNYRLLNYTVNAKNVRLGPRGFNFCDEY